MLVISKDQMNVFSDFMFGQFKNRMAHNLQENFPEKTSAISDEDLHTLILEGIDKAESYDITDEVDIERYLECMMRYGPDFDHSPSTSWAVDILNEDDITGTEKMNKINDYELFILMDDNDE